MGRSLLAAVLFLTVLSVAWAAYPDSPPGDGASGPGEKAPAGNANEAPRGSAELKSDQQKGSYAMGFALGTNLRTQFGSNVIDPSAFLMGVRESLGGSKPSLAQRDRDQALQRFGATLRQKQVAAAAAAADTNKRNGQAFLAANKNREGVKTLKSGVQYQVIREGKGKKPKATDTVEVHYHGTLVNGTVFDSSVERGEPATLPLDQVIPAWTETVQMMKEGSKWRIFVPGDQAYRARGRPPKIGPNETLIFDIELLKVQ